jgi:hypothetical protein
MQIKGTKVLILGGWGLVGSAICRQLMEHSPAKIIVSSLNRHEAEDAVAQLRKEYPNADLAMFEGKWGNIFTRMDWKDEKWADILNSDECLPGAVDDIFNELDNEILNRSFLYNLIEESKPDIVIDCINTATSFAYLDIYNTTQKVRREMNNDELKKHSVERLMTNMYIPQLIRHIQVIYRALLDAKSTLYLKIGTSGTGGMGLNIPYTHSEERPSRVLLSKTAMAGAQTLLLFLMGRTPGGPIIKEIKPTAAIAWKKIAYGKILRKGRTIPLIDMNVNDAHSINGTFKFSNNDGVKPTGNDYEAVYIDTGENGIFSKGEFQAIGSLGQMEIVTPEEIAAYAVYEIQGGNTGKDVIQGLDAFTLGPTYRGGMLYNKAMCMIEKLENAHGDSIAFEMLGPPRLSKLLYEAYILKQVAGSMQKALDIPSEELSAKALELLKSDDRMRSEMLSIGLVVLLPDGKKYLRGSDVKIPANIGDDEITMNDKSIEKWCYEAWIDLRPGNFDNWHKCFKKIIQIAEAVPENDTSSRYAYTKDYWKNFESIEVGKIVGWIFENDDKGWRFKR